MIHAERASRRFGSRIAVEELTFEVAAGEIFALLGPNGAGKTTTLWLLAGLIAPSSGWVAIDGLQWSRRVAGRLRRRVGLLTETPGLWDRLTVWDNLVTYARLYEVGDPDAAAGRLLREFDLLDRRADPAAVLSKGMKQKLALARALVHDPPVLLLDEPTAGLDPQMARDVRQRILALRREGRAIVLCTHNLDEAERLADRVAVLDRRLLALDTPAGLRTRLFGQRVRIRLSGQDARRFVEPATAAGGRDVKADGSTLSLALDDPDREAPAVVRALVDHGAAIRTVEAERTPLEAIYLRLFEDTRATDGEDLPA